MTDKIKTLKTLMDRTAELVDMYYDLPEPTEVDSVDEIHSRLLTVRSCMSSLSGVLSDTYMLQAMMRSNLSVAKGKLEDQEASVVSSGQTHTTEFYTGVERKANLRAKNLEAEIEVRKAQDSFDFVSSFLEMVRVNHREMDRAVRDLELRFRILGFGSM